MDPVKAKANYSRVCQLLVDKGSDVLRAALHAKHPPSTLAAVLNANKKILQKIRYSVIKASQWNLLFPVSGAPDSNNFDITLLTILLRNICGLASPAAGWNVMPPASDTSISANILRIKILRNEICGHVPSAQYDDTTFETLWQEISKPLIKLGIPQHDINELKEAPLSPEEESYIEKLKEWKELEDDLFSKLNCVEREVVEVKDEVVNVGNSVVNVENKVVELRKIVENATPSQVGQLAKFDFTGKIDGLCKKFHDGTRQWFFDKLSSWFMNEESRVMILTAGPGIGKSVLSAKVYEMFKQSGQLAAYHFCDFRKTDYSDPHRILQSLASQMCDNVDGFNDKLTEVLRREHSRDTLSDAFRVLLNDPLHALKRRDPMLIVVDALDESKTDVKSEFLELISDEFPELPNWIKILISSRPELQVRKKLEHLSPVEIRPDDHHHNLDLENFIRHWLSNLNEDNVSLLISKCEGSFLYAYYLVNELKQMDLGIEPNLSDYVAKGISGFYEKQFKRLKTGLQRYKQDTWSCILKSFINVVAASREPLPIKIIFTCMGLSAEEYEIRKAIIEIMSEILPVYDDCLSVYHKSLWDWLALDGYVEHAFVADVADGIEHLWCACKNIYSDIDSLRSVSDFQISPEKRYALTNGAKYLVNVGDTQDFHWLVHVKLNFLKLKFCNDLNVDFSRILRIYRSTLTNNLYWGIIQLHNILKIIQIRAFSIQGYSREICYIYLQSLAKGYFGFVENTITYKNTARDILYKTNEVWMEEMANESNSNFKIIANAVFETKQDSIVLSPNNKLLACLHERTVKVFKLPSLRMIFGLDVVSEVSLFSRFLTFSPDSSYFLYNSVRTCVCIREQKEVPFIPHGPVSIIYCSFSSCGKNLVTSEEKLIKVWDVRKKELLVSVEIEFDIDYCMFSNCNSYILVWPWEAFDFDDPPILDYIAVLESTKLKRLDIKNIDVDTCLTYEDYVQIISPPPSYFDFNVSIGIDRFQLPTGEKVLITNKYCSKPFTWKDRKCVISSNSSKSSFSLVVYDFVNQEVVDMFEIGCLPSETHIDFISKLDETNFLICLDYYQVFLLSFKTSTENSVAPVVNNADVKCCALSPDNLYLACCYESRILTIMSVDNGETLQTVVLKQPPEACWWSESYLWVVCKGVVVKYPYDSTHTKVLGNGLDERSIKFESILNFKEGVVVIRLRDNGEISILKICNGELCPQQILDSNFLAFSVAISSDGCAVLLCCQYSSGYQLWELASENRWELASTGNLRGINEADWVCLTGTRNFRSSLWLMRYRNDPFNQNLCLSSIDFTNDAQVVNELPIKHNDVKGVIYVNSNFLVIHQDVWIHFINVSDGKIITTKYLSQLSHLKNVSSFYLASRGLLLLVARNHIRYFKIHNIENYLPYLTKD